MKQLFAVFIFSLTFSLASAQYYVMPKWTIDLPYATNGLDIYAIGISDPRMTDITLAEEVAIHRAISIALILNEANIYYASDYFEKKSEEYRWFLMKEEIEELGKFEAKGYVDVSNYDVIAKQINDNGEMIILLRYTPLCDSVANFFVKGEYYRQDFEVSNTRAHESIRSLHLNTYWLKNASDTISSDFRMTNYNGSISSKISFNTEDIIPPGYFYYYETNLPEDFNLIDYNTSVKLLKGLWIGYIDSFVQSILSMSKNYSSKMETRYNDYDVNRDDGISETSQEIMARSVCSNTLSFEYGGIAITTNSIFPRIYLSGERAKYRSYKRIKQVKNINNAPKDREEKKCWLGRIFSKKDTNKN